MYSPAHICFDVRSQSPISRFEVQWVSWLAASCYRVSASHSSHSFLPVITQRLRLNSFHGWWTPLKATSRESRLPARSSMVCWKNATVWCWGDEWFATFISSVGVVTFFVYGRYRHTSFFANFDWLIPKPRLMHACISTNKNKQHKPACAHYSSDLARLRVNLSNERKSKRLATSVSDQNS